MKTMTSPSLFPAPAGDSDPPRDPRGGIPAGPPVDETPRAQFRPLVCKTLLNENQNRSLPFRWTINPYRGCEFGCAYCYARYTHKYIERSDPSEFDSRIFVKFQAPAVLADQLRPERIRGAPIALGTATDPYQPAEKRFRITRGVLEVLARCPEVDLSITTKSPLILRDIDLLRRIARNGRLTCHISLITLNPAISRIVDRWAPTPRRRLETLRGLRSDGIEAGIFVMPILPGITDAPSELRALLRAARSAGSCYAEGAVVRLAGASWRSFEPILRSRFPDLLTPYRSMRDPEGVFMPSVTRSIQTRFREICEEVGIPSRTPGPRVPPDGSFGSGWLFT